MHVHSNGVPDRAACLALMDEHRMLPNIRRHSLVVADIALFIARELNRRGANLNPNLIQAASLLHDITKTRSLESGEKHAVTGAALLQARGFPRVAEIVRAHVVPERCDDGVSEEEVVCYADKRVLHERVVTLDERFQYLFDRYGRSEAAVKSIRAMKARLEEIEKKLSAGTELTTLEGLQGCLGGVFE